MKARQAHDLPTLALVVTRTLATTVEMQVGNLPDEQVHLGESVLLRSNSYAPTPEFGGRRPTDYAVARQDYGRGCGVGRGEGGGGTGVMCGGGVGRGAGVPALVRGVGVGRVGGFELHGGAHNTPSLYWVRIST